MPLWLQILLQVLEAALQSIVSHPPAATASPEELDEHKAHIQKVKAAIAVLKS